MKDVTAAIIIKNNQILIMRRAANEKHAGGWEFPGGKVELNETPQECLRRELFEELSIDAEINDLFAESIYEYKQGSIRLLAYFAEIIKGKINLSVHDRYEWVDASDLTRYDLLPADVPIAMKLREVI